MPPGVARAGSSGIGTNNTSITDANGKLIRYLVELRHYVLEYIVPETAPPEPIKPRTELLERTKPRRRRRSAAAHRW
jgi:hypothetical protein